MVARLRGKERQIRDAYAHRRAAEEALSGLLYEIEGIPIEYFDAAQCGVYFLFDGPNLIYVGQSTSILSRISSHHVYGFNRVKFIRCDASALNDVEGFFIRLLEPPANRDKNGKIQGPKSKINDWPDFVKAISV